MKPSCCTVFHLMVGWIMPILLKENVPGGKHFEVLFPASFNENGRIYRQITVVPWYSVLICSWRHDGYQKLWVPNKPGDLPWCDHLFWPGKTFLSVLFPMSVTFPAWLTSFPPSAADLSSFCSVPNTKEATSTETTLSHQCAQSTKFVKYWGTTVAEK